MKVAIVHDQLYTFGGAERVLKEILACFPEADLFALFDLLPQAARGFLAGRRVRTTGYQRLPFLRRLHRQYFALAPIMIEQLDLRAYDLVISSSYLVAKGVLTRPDQVHVCYLHTPMRYAWDMQEDYLQQLGLVRGIRGMVVRAGLHYMRLWDVRSSLGVDRFIANSAYVARRLRRTCRRESVVLHPPVDVERFLAIPRRDVQPNRFVTVSRLVPYKRVDLLVEAFRALPGSELVIIGDGPERARLAAAATPNVRLLGHVSNGEMDRYLGSSAAFLYAAEEDFGIAPVEAQAAGLPVIAYGRGGVRETVVVPLNAAPTGMFFRSQSAGDILAAVRSFQQNRTMFSEAACRRRAERYKPEYFVQAFVQIISECLKEDRGTIDGQPYEIRPMRHLGDYDELNPAA